MKNDNKKSKKHVGDLNNEGVNYIVKKAKQKAVITAIAVACVLAFFMTAGALIFNSEKMNKVEEKVQINRPTMRILFVGNSLTSYNAMPEMLKNMALSDPSAGVQIEVGQYTVDGARLSQLWNAPERPSYIQNTTWDFVIFQPQSMWASTKATTDEVDRALKPWIQATKAAGALPVYVMTWPKQPGSTWYEKQKSLIGGPAEMFQNLNNRTRYIVAKNNLLEISAGKHWAYGVIHYKTLNLYHEDGSHPSLQGSFLLALLIYKNLVDKTLRDISYTPDGISAEEKNLLINLAEEPLNEK